VFYWPVDDEIRLRVWETADAERLAALVHAQVEYLAQWLPFATEAYDVDDALSYIERTRRKWAAYQACELALLVAPDWEIAGSVGIHAIDYLNGRGEIGYWLSQSHQGRGLMTRAVKALVTHAFSVLGLNRVEIRAQPGNRKSRAIPERLGFTEEALLREDLRHPDGYVDHVVYGLLKKEWAGV
jgi:ribosomal-protein-serine acetyltransferase